MIRVETLRKYPPAAFLMRQSIEPHIFDGTSFTISKNQRVWIPVHAIHRDSDIYPEPDVFDPERFDEKIAQSRNAMFYLPFGDGPRNCIGMLKYMFVYLLYLYQIAFSEERFGKMLIICTKWLNFYF